MMVLALSALSVLTKLIPGKLLERIAIAHKDFDLEAPATPSKHDGFPAMESRVS